MAVGYTLDELRGLYNRNRYKRDVWDRMHDFAPGLTKEELETIVGETRKEQYEGRKKKAVSMRASGAKPEEIAAVIDMSVNTVKNLTSKWQKELGFVSQDQEREPEIPSEEPQAEESPKQTTEQENEEMFTNIRPSPAVTLTIPPMPAFSNENASDAVLASRKASPSELMQKEQEEERQILYRKVEELEKRNENLKEAVANLTVRTPSPAGMAQREEASDAITTDRTPSPAGMAQREEASDAITTDRTPSPAGMAQREEASAEKEAPSVRSLIREAMELISDGTLGDGERISIETTNMGTTVLIEKLP